MRIHETHAAGAVETTFFCPFCRLTCPVRVQAHGVATGTAFNGADAMRQAADEAFAREVQRILVHSPCFSCGKAEPLPDPRLRNVAIALAISVVLLLAWGPLTTDANMTDSLKASGGWVLFALPISIALLHAWLEPRVLHGRMIRIDAPSGAR